MKPISSRSATLSDGNYQEVGGWSTRAMLVLSRVLRDLRGSDFCTGIFRGDNIATRCGQIGLHAGLSTSACHPTSDIPRLELDFRF
jgi:hypothetical protein